MANTTNFNWETPDDTDLVKDGAAAIRTLGNSIDTSFVDFKGGTTGQVLAKASNTDLDFTWTADATGIPATIFDAKGDLIAASAADTAARLAVGTNGQVLAANSSTATGLEWQTISSGGYTQIASGTASGSSLVLTSIPATYRDLVVIWRNVRPDSNGEQLLFRFNNDSTSSRHQSTEANAADALTFNGTSVSTDPGTNSGATNANTFKIIRFYDYANTSTYKMAEITQMNTDETTNTSFDFRRRFGFYNQTGAISSIGFLWSGSANFNAGTYVLYGVK